MAAEKLSRQHFEVLWLLLLLHRPFTEIKYLERGESARFAFPLTLTYNMTYQPFSKWLVLTGAGGPPQLTFAGPSQIIESEAQVPPSGQA
jgi:hypothetical protein